MTNTFVYNTQKAGGFFDKLSLKKRLEMGKLFFDKFPEEGMANLLDVGVTADKEFLSSNYIEHMMKDKAKITALSNQDAYFLEEVFQGIRFVKGDALALPFEDNTFDVVFSSAVLEHVGSYENQKKMLSECARVSKHGLFITTPNKLFPVDLHTVLPFVHWLPRGLRSWVLRVLGKGFLLMKPI